MFKSIFDHLVALKIDPFSSEELSRKKSLQLILNQTCISISFLDFQRTINFRQNAKFVIKHVFENAGVLKIPHDGLPKDHMWKVVYYWIPGISSFYRFFLRFICGHFRLEVRICHGRFRVDFANIPTWKVSLTTKVQNRHQCHCRGIPSQPHVNLWPAAGANFWLNLFKSIYWQTFR